MMLTPDECRREAELSEQAARCVSLQSDREELLAAARSLRQLADEMLAQWKRQHHHHQI
jgi:hypothetical protein